MAVATLYQELWPLENYDFILRTGLIGALSSLSAIKMRSVGVVGQLSHRLPLFCFLPTISCDEVAKIESSFLKALETEEHLDKLRTGAFKLAAGPAAADVWCVLREVRLKSESVNGVYPKSFSGNFCALFLRIPRVMANDVRKAQWEQFCSESVVPMLFDIFRHRERRMMPFAPRTSQLYWQEAGKAINLSRMRPPWDEVNAAVAANTMRETVTLCVDMRKSTFCMDQAESQPRLGRWLDKLVQLIIRVCHEHGGVFDKFTGDGGLMHFLGKECQATVGTSSIEAAIRCAIDLCSQIDETLPELRRNLRNNSGLLGAGISLAMSEAFWSVDHRDNPIVVGHGVVDACRICDGTPPRTIRMSNFAHGRLTEAAPALASLFREIELGRTKEWTELMQIKVWEMKAG